MSPLPWKRFEEDFVKSKPPKMFLLRLKTRASGFKGDDEMADYVAYRYPHFFVFELKSMDGLRLDFSKIRGNQITKILEAVGYEGIYGGIVLQLRENYTHWYIPINVLEQYIRDGKKSLSYKTLLSDPNIIEIASTKKRVSVRLDIDKLMGDIEKEE